MSLSVYHAFGHRLEASASALFFAEQGLLYPAGRQVVLNELQKRVQRFVGATPGAAMEGISALAICPNRRYAAFAQRGERPSIALFDVFTLKRREDLSVSEGGQSREFVSVAFSPDAKCVIAQSGAPDWNLYCWAWEKLKPLASVRSGISVAGGTAQQQPQVSPITAVQYSPNDVSLISVLGPATYRLFRLGDGLLRPVPVPPSTQKQLAAAGFNCHAWVSGDRVVVGTTTGELLLFELAEYRATIPQQQQQQQHAQPAITAIVAVGKGFVCGDANGGVHYYERSDDSSYFRRKATFSLASPSGSAEALGSVAGSSAVRQLTVNASEGLLAAVLETNELRVLDFSAASSRISGNTLLESPLARSCHAREVTGMDVCLRKPLLATCSTDHTVRIWNYRHNSVMLAKTFPEEAYSVAMHPMGAHVVVGFADKLRCANLLLDDIAVFSEIDLKGCREVRFSGGGGVFAAVSGNNIAVYSTYSLECLATLKGHSQRVRSIFFSADDSCLVSAGVDGAVICWNMHNYRRLPELGTMMRAVQFTAVACLPEASAIFTAGSDKAIREIVGGQLRNEHMQDVALTAMTVAAASSAGQHTVLVAGTASGSVRLFRHPLGGEGNCVASELFLHSGPVSRLRFSRDGNMLFSAGEDGSVFAIDVKDSTGKLRALQELDYDDEVVVTRAALEEREIAVSEARAKLTEIERDHEAKMRLRELSETQNLREITDKHAREVEVLRANHAALAEAKSHAEKAAADELRQERERNAARLAELEQRNQERVAIETQRNAELATALEELQSRSEAELRHAKEEAARALAVAEEERQNQIAQVQAELQRTRDAAAEAERAFAEEREQAELDADEEIAARREAMERRLDDEVQGHAATRNAWEAQQRKIKAVQRELEEQKMANSTMQAQVKQLTDTIRALERDRDARVAELGEWDNTVREKDRRIAELRQQATELEKLKFVLDFKIQELNGQLAPLHAEITAQRDQTRRMNEELSANHAKFQELSFQLSSLQNKSAAAAHEAATNRRRLAETETKLERLRSDVHRLGELIQDPVRLKAAVKELLGRVGAKEDSAADTQADVQAEMARQRDHLERAMESLRNKVAKERTAAAKENQRLIRENVALIAEINALRREAKEFRAAGRELGGSSSASAAAVAAAAAAEAQKMLGLQREELSKLRRRVAELEAAMAARFRPFSRETLPPMESTSRHGTAFGGPGLDEDGMP